VPRAEAPDAGSATVETALALPSLLLLTLALCGIISGLAMQIRCVDAARLGARATARGESEAAVRDAIAAELPHGQVTIASAAGFVHVQVSTPVVGLPLLRGFVVHATAEEAEEGGADDATP
jgi:Flp pilus assembly protein TadG